MKSLKSLKGIARIIVPSLILLLVIIAYVGQRYYVTNRSVRASSDHYEISATRQDIAFSQSLIAPLEESYKAVNDAMGFDNKSIHHVIVFKSYDHYYDFLYSLLPSWRDSYIGYVSAEGKNIKVTSPNAKGLENLTQEALIEEIKYENVLDILNHNRYSIEKEPMWLIEGIASHFTASDALKADYLTAVKNNPFPDIETILSMPQGRAGLMNQSIDAFGQEEGLAFSYYMVDYIINTYSYDTLRSIFDNPDTLLDTLGENSQQDFVNKVQNYINEQ